MPILRPSTDEYDLYYAHYVDRVATDDVLDLLEAQGRNTVATFSEVADERANVQPGPGEWSIKEVVGRRVCNHNHPQVDSNTRECRSIERASAEELWHTARASQRAWG